MARSRKFNDYLIEQLKTPKAIKEYFYAILQECEECDERECRQLLLQAFNNIAQAQGGIGQLSEKTKLSRTSLYKSLSANANPKLSTLLVIANALIFSKMRKK